MKKEDNRQEDSKEIEKIIKGFLKMENTTLGIMKLIINNIEIH